MMAGLFIRAVADLTAPASLPHNRFKAFRRLAGYRRIKSCSRAAVAADAAHLISITQSLQPSGERPLNDVPSGNLRPE